MPLDPEDRAELKGIIIEAVTEAALAANSAASEEAAAGIEEAIDDAVDKVEDVVTDATDADGDDIDEPDTVMAANGDSLGGEAPGFAGIEPVIVDAEPARKHWYWSGFGRRD